VPDTGHTKSNGKEYKMSGVRAGAKAQRAKNVAQGTLEDIKNKPLATGAISAKTTKAGNKPLSMGAYRSMTSKQRADEKLKASQMYRAGKITENEMEAIHKKVDDANAAEVRASAAKGSGSKKKVTLTELEKGKPDRELRKGGMPFNKGGMSSHKGNFDMRKGGMFSK
jgi:hypothetical protein